MTRGMEPLEARAASRRLARGEAPHPRRAPAVRPATVSLASVGLLGPGLTGWAQAARLLREDQAFEPHPVVATAPRVLPANERRRSTFAIRMALEASQQAVDAAGADVSRLRSVFACSGGDTETLDRICTALTTPGRPVSPAHFHNSVHNAPAGYWSIACGSHAASTSVCAYDATFSAGLMEAYGVALEAPGPVLLVAYDVPPPEALHPFRPLSAPFACALLLDAGAGRGGMRLRLALERAGALAEDTMADSGLEALRTGNPAARALPLLARLAAENAGSVALPYIDDDLLRVELRRES